ncbi:MAG: hypothetical protein GXP25_01050 [Planctomycetes bacterium]|nr:hypothetical protein [Planctomycetota bacterium]
MLILIVGLHCVIFEGGVGGADGWSYFANLQSFVDDCDLDLTNNRLTFPEGYVVKPYMEGYNGRYVTHEPLGATFFQAPFYVFGKVAAVVAPPNLKINRVPYSSLDGQTIVKVFSMILANNFWSIFAVLLVYYTARRAGVREWPAFWAALFCFFGGPLHWYAIVGLSHAASSFCTALMLYVFLRAIQAEGKTRLLLIALTGLIIGLNSTVRYTNGLMIFPVALYILLANVRGIKRLFTEEIALGIGCSLTVWITFAYWKVQFGRFLYHPHAEVGEFHLTLLPPPLAKILFSDQHGFFVFNPVFLLALVGLVLMFLRHRNNEADIRRLSAVAFLCFCACAFIYDSYVEWAGHGTYSTRFLTNGVILMAPGLAYFLNEVKWKRIAYALAGLAAAFSYALFLMSRARLIYQHGDPTSVGLRLSDYTYIFREGVSLSEIASKIIGSSITLKLITSKTPLLCAAIGGCVVLAALILLYIKRLRPRWIEGEARPA